MILNLLLWISIQIAATISPGPAFAMTVRTATSNGRRPAIAQAIGLGLGVGTLLLMVACGLALVIQQSLLLFNIIKFAGAGYLAYIGIKALLTKKKSVAAPTAAEALPASLKPMSDLQAFRRGYLTNLLNPKAIVFLTAVFTQFLHHGTPIWLIGTYFLISVMSDFTWFTLVSIILTHTAIRARYMAIAHWIERVCGALLVGLAIKVFLYRPRTA